MATIGGPWVLFWLHDAMSPKMLSPVIPSHRNSKPSGVVPTTFLQNRSSFLAAPGAGSLGISGKKGGDCLTFSGSSAQSGQKRSARQWIKDCFTQIWRVLKKPFQWIGFLLQKLGLKKKAADERANLPKPAGMAEKPPSPDGVKPAPVEPVAVTYSIPHFPLGPLTPQQLFGADLAQVKMRQGNWHTCYLLSALDTIFHQPAAFRLLNQIKFSRVQDGFEVRFPGQQGPLTREQGAKKPVIKVPDSALTGGIGYQGVHTDCLGVRILEQAYAQIPGNRVHLTGRDAFDNIEDPLKRIFGPAIINEYCGIHEFLNNPSASINDHQYLKILTGVTRIADNEGNVSPGIHHYAFWVNPSDPKQVYRVDPYDTGLPAPQTTQQVLSDHWYPCLIKIPLDENRHKNLLNDQSQAMRHARWSFWPLI